MHVSVVNSYAATALFAFVTADSSDDLPTDGKPTKATRAIPIRLTSKVAYVELELRDASSISFASNYAILAFSLPKWCSVALFFYVLAISCLISSIYSSIPILPCLFKKKLKGWELQ